MHLEVPLDWKRENRFTFLETNRLPKDLRKKLSQEQMDRMPYKDWSLSQSYPSSCDVTPASHVRKTEHLRQMYHRKTKLWSGSIARRNEKRELGRVATAVDITKSLNIPTIKPDNFYLVMGTSNNDHIPQTSSEDTEGRCYSKQTNTQPFRRSTSELRLVTGLEYPSLRVESRTCGTLALRGRPSQPSRKYTSSKVGDLVSNSCSDNVNSSKLPTMTTTPVMTQRMHAMIGSKHSGAFDKSKLEPDEIGEPKKVWNQPEFQQEMVTRGVLCEGELCEERKAGNLSRRIGTSRLPSVTNRQKLRRPATSNVNDTGDWNRPGSSEEMEDGCMIRKRVIPSLAHLTEVMHSCKAFQGVESTDNDKHRYLSQEYSFHVINKYHGNQIVVDSTEYDNFARKLIKK